MDFMTRDEQSWSADFAIGNPFIKIRFISGDLPSKDFLEKSLIKN